MKILKIISSIVIFIITSVISFGLLFTLMFLLTEYCTPALCAVINTNTLVLSIMLFTIPVLIGSVLTIIFLRLMKARPNLWLAVPKYLIVFVISLIIPIILIFAFKDVPNKTEVFKYSGFGMCYDCVTASTSKGWPLPTEETLIGEVWGEQTTAIPQNIIINYLIFFASSSFIGVMFINKKYIFRNKKS